MLGKALAQSHDRGRSAWPADRQHLELHDVAESGEVRDRLLMVAAVVDLHRDLALEWAHRDRSGGGDLGHCQVMYQTASRRWRGVEHDVDPGRGHTRNARNERER